MYLIHPKMIKVSIPLLSALFLIISILTSAAKSEEPRDKRELRSSDSAITISQFLWAHNTVRAQHHLPPLKWSSKLANYAKWYANQRRRDCALVHSAASDYGENIFWGRGRRWNVRDPVNAWASEEAYYNYKTNSCSPGKDCWHYTQLVWRNTKQVGCARIKCRSGDTFIVCEYFPPGNFVGLRPY